MSPWLHRIYLTHVKLDIECDVFFPEFDESQFTIVRYCIGMTRIVLCGKGTTLVIKMLTVFLQLKNNSKKKLRLQLLISEVLTNH